MTVRLLLTFLLGTGLAALSGCGQPPQASFVLGKKTGDLIDEAENVVETVLDENFGTPHRLVAWERFPIDYGAPQSEAADPERRAAGWRLKEGRNLYMQHCLHCHGVSGDGAGPTARYLSPRPRDYRQGTFKFKSTFLPMKPARADLVRTLKEGIPGTYMPSFVFLGEEKLELMVDYVRWLSCRGEMEEKLATYLAGAGASQREVDSRLEELRAEAKEAKKRVSANELRKSLVGDTMKTIEEELAEQIEQTAGDIADSWASAELPESVITPKAKRTPPTQESLERGRELYLSVKKKTQCADCHGPQGRGDGPNTQLFWPVPNTAPEVKYEDVGLHDDWGERQQPRNLTRGLYRGGRRPVDIFRRIYTGIRGTQMPGFGGTILNDEEIWDLVNYVLSIPFEGKESPYAGAVPEAAAAEEIAAKE